MNPEKMRSEYGKLIYMLQDSMLPHVQELLNFKVVKPMTTVHSYLSDRDAEELLTDPLMAIATREILSEGKSRHEVSKEVRINTIILYGLYSTSFALKSNFLLSSVGDF